MDAGRLPKSTPREFESAHAQPRRPAAVGGRIDASSDIAADDPERFLFSLNPADPRTAHVVIQDGGWFGGQKPLCDPFPTNFARVLLRLRAHADFSWRAAPGSDDGTMRFQGATNGECFRAYVEQFRAPTIKQGDLDGMDNLYSHKSGARSGRAERGFDIYRPIPLTSTRSNKPSPRSSIRCDRPRREQSRLLRDTSTTSSKPSSQANARTVSLMPDAFQRYREKL